MRKVLFLIPALTGGGAEKAMMHVLKNIDRTEIVPLLCVFEKKGELLSELPQDIEIIELKGRMGRLLKWPIIINFAKLLNDRDPEIVVSLMWEANVVALASRLISKTSCRIIVSERISLLYPFEGLARNRLRKFALSYLYPRADIIHFNSKDAALEFQKMEGIASNKVAMIYNPVDVEQIRCMAEEKSQAFRNQEAVSIIIASGRLTKQKGFAFLIKGVGILLSEGIKCRLVILGKGTEEAALKKLARDLHVDNAVEFLGFQSNPYKYVARADVFVLSSLYEGFPNALLEAQVLGVPCVATRCPTGPDEIITDGVNGLLVPPADDEALAGAIKRLLGDKELRDKFSEAGKKKAEQFRVEKIVKQYENLIEKVCAGSAGR